ncbi:MAG TPA: hypothetical protein VGJ77_15535 [Gaiellaceae bacterium]
MRRALLLLALVVPALAAACGGGSESKEEPRLTQKQFVEQANQVCIRSDRRVFQIGDLSADPAGWSKTVDAAEKGIEEMAELRPPADRQQQFDRLLATARKLKTAIADVRDALTAGDVAKAQKAQRRATNDDTSIKKQASRLGLTFCEQLLTNWPA